MSDLLRRLRFLFSRARFERELEEEMQHHAGMSGRRRFGNITLIKEESHAMWTFAFWEQLGQDVRYGLRAMSANKLFTAMAVLSLALGIGANTAIYSLMDAVMIRALPVPHPDELAIVNWRSKVTPPPLVHNLYGNGYPEPGGGGASPNFAWPAYEILQADNTAFSSLFAYRSAGRIKLVFHGQAELREVELVIGRFFSGLGIVPAVGRLLQDNDNRAAVLSYSFWHDRMAADPAVTGQSIRINDVAFEIAGVAPPEFFGVRSGAMAYAVSRGTNEIGIRMALGAERRRIVWMVLREVLTLAVSGVAIGLGCAWAAASAVKSFLFGMKPGDPVAIAISVSVLAGAMLVAGYAPARRASRVDSMQALRHE